VLLNGGAAAAVGDPVGQTRLRARRCKADLSRVRGQPIRPVLAGFGEPVTDWLFQSAMEARPGESAFAVQAGPDWPRSEGWLCAFGLRWLGSARRLAAPDSLVPVFWGAAAWSVWDSRRFCCRKKAQKPQKVPSSEPAAPFRGSSIRGPNQRLVSQGQTRQVAADLAALIAGVEGSEPATADVTL